MRTEEFRVLVYSYEKFSDLSDADQELIFHARKAVQNAYAPYSAFRVGASLLLENKEILTGCNQENAAFPCGMCAERVVLHYANSLYPKVPPEALAMSADHRGKVVEWPVTPCGLCRQTIYEAECRFEKSVRIILDGRKKILVFEGISHLLPFAFRPGLPG